jgi:predicted PurR-regulated permease PerM
MSADQPTPEVPRGLVIGLCIAAVLILAPLWSWLVLAVWVGDLGRRMVKPLTRLTGRRQRAAALLTVVLLALIVVPLGLIAFTLIGDAIALAQRLAESNQARAVFEELVTEGPSGESPNPIDLLMAHGGRAWGVVSVVFSIAAQVLLGLFVFISGTYVVLADGPRAYAWFERHAPIPPAVFRRFADAFKETGHGLFIGVGGAGLAQAVIATIAYVVIGVPEPFVLGLLTLAASVVPSVGTALVWIPVTIGLALTGRTDAAIGLTVVGVAVIGSIDNVVRPLLAKWGSLDLPSYLIMVGMFGGLALIGASGIILGPLVLRLAKEALVMARESRGAGDDPAAPPEA